MSPGSHCCALPAVMVFLPLSLFAITQGCNSPRSAPQTHSAGGRSEKPITRASLEERTPQAQSSVDRSEPPVAAYSAGGCVVSLNSKDLQIECSFDECPSLLTAVVTGASRAYIEQVHGDDWLLHVVNDKPPHHPLPPARLLAGPAEFELRLMPENPGSETPVGTWGLSAGPCSANDAATRVLREGSSEVRLKPVVFAHADAASRILKDESGRQRITLDSITVKKTLRTETP